MTSSPACRRSILKSVSAVLLASLAGTWAADEGGRLMAYVGTYTSPLKNMRPTQVDLPQGERARHPSV
jgi:hypothetical protein